MIIRLILAIILFSPTFSFSQQKNFKRIANGVFLTEIVLGENCSNLIVLKSLPNSVILNYTYSKDNTLLANDVVQSRKLLAGINTNYFDVGGHPLGLLFRKPETFNKLYKSGSVLTGILEVYINKNSTFKSAKILSREDEIHGDLALQAGPRLIVDSEPTKLKDLTYSRRSGICLDNANSLFIYATKDGYPGATFKTLQAALLDIGCKNALNFDGGRSSQFYISPKGDLKKEIYVGGNDYVPVVLTLSLP